MTRALPLPTFFAPRSAAEWGYRPDAQRLFDSAVRWRREHRIPPAAADRFEIHLLLVDVQKDFCFPEGTLYVAGRSGSGAIEDSRRIAEFIHRNLAAITRITTTLDTHFAFQIFFPSFWVGADGAPLRPHRTISTEEIATGAVRPNPDIARWVAGGDLTFLEKQVRHYTSELERAGKYQLYLWPPHCLLGSDGHALVGVVQEARLFHSYARSAQSWGEVKGGHPLTEHYSVLRPEVLTRWDGRPLAERNVAFLETLLEADALIIAGEAASHCVRWTVDDLLDEIRRRDASLARKVCVLTDCMSAVTVPDGKGGFTVDFTADTQAAMARWAEAGMHLVRSTEPMEGWPGIEIG